jgi:hypothetical protein
VMQNSAVLAVEYRKAVYVKQPPLLGNLPPKPG